MHRVPASVSMWRAAGRRSGHQSRRAVDIAALGQRGQAVISLLTLVARSPVTQPCVIQMCGVSPKVGGLGDAGTGRHG